MWVSAPTTKSMTDTPSPESNKPLWLALGLATVLTAAFSLVLALNEDLRRTTFVLVETITNEQGVEEERIRVERPEPNREQVREIARNEERKQEQNLEENAREIRDAVEQLRDQADQLEASLTPVSTWEHLLDRLGEAREKFERFKAELNREEVGRLEATPTLKILSSRFEMQQRFVENYVQTAPEETTPWHLLGDAYEMEERLHDLNRRLNTVRTSHRQRTGDWILSAENKLADDARDGMKEYRQALEEQLYGTVFLEDQTLADSDLIPDPEDMEEWDNESNLLTDEELAEMTAAELYQTIREMAEYLDEAFAEQRAAELAAVEQIPLEEARERIHAPETRTGPDLSEALTEPPPETLEAFREFAQTLNQAGRTAEHVARTARNRTGEPQAQQSANAQQLQQALQQRTQAAAQMTRMASNQGRPQGNLQDLTATMQAAYGANMGSEGVTLSQSYRSDLNVGDGSGSGNRSVTRLNARRVVKQALPGRRLDPRAERKGWIFLDTWYMIGPWDRPNQNSFDTPFPPEIEVDLDATYAGKNHPRTDSPMELEWRFVQTENIRVNPPDEIGDSVYYGYTEVFAAEAMEVVIAVASDDIAKLWVNDLVVWEDEGLSSWRLDEGFRKILLKPGYNQVLLRVENGPAVCYFSVLMCPVNALNR